MDAYEQGYRVRGEKVIKLSTGKEHSLQLLNNKGYRLYRFSITLSNTKNRRRSVFVHQLLAYQKYGMSAFESGIVVRHLDGDSLNNEHNNVIIGSQSDNMMDRPAGQRLEHSIKAATIIRRFTDKEIVIIKKFHKGSYKETMDRFNISSKGTLHYILNTQYQTTV